MIPTIYCPEEKTRSNLSEITPSKPNQTSTIFESNGLFEKKRLIVLIPPQICNEAEISKYILNLALADNSDVILVMLVSSYKDEIIGYLRISAITTFLRTFHFIVKSQIVWGKSWIEAGKEFIRPGDVVVCPKELNTPTRIFFRESLSNQLIRKLTVTVHTYSGFIDQVQTPQWEIARRLAYWIGIILIATGFFWIESSTDLSMTGWISKTILILLVIVEVVAIYFWSSIIG